MAIKGLKVVELLVQSKLITDEQFAKAKELATGPEAKASSTLDALIKLGFIDEKILLEFLSKQYGVPVIDLTQFGIDPELIRLVPREVAEKHVCIPVKCSGTTLNWESEEIDDREEDNHPEVSGLESAKGTYLCLLEGEGCELLEGGGLFVVNASDMGEAMEQLKMLRGDVLASMQCLNISLISVGPILAQRLEQEPNFKKELARLLRGERKR